MNAAEILFLAIGLCLGVAVGAALLDLVRARPAPREVRLTITRNALPEREAAIDLEHAPLVERVPIRVARGVDPAYAAIRQADEPAMVGAVTVSAAAAMRSGDAGDDVGRTDRGGDGRRRGHDGDGRGVVRRRLARRRRASGPRSIRTTRAPPSDAWPMSAARSPSAPRSRPRPPPPT